MKSRTSFFNLTVLKKDITRFAPAWGLYLTAMLLLMTTSFANSDYRLASDLGVTINVLSIVNLGYALACAALLFGDLFNSRLCNALHAMPLRREGWFVTHLISGLLFSVVPNLIVGLAMMPRLGVYWFVALIWVGGLTASYLFCFGAAVLSAMCTGSRFAMTLVYGLINFLSILVMWVVDFLYIPLMFGVEIREEIFVFLSPVSYLCSNELNYLNFLDKIQNYYNLNNGWPYTIGTALVGAVMLAGALLIYRKRHLESAGDFITVPFLGPVFLTLYTLAAGMILYGFASLFGVDQEYVFLAVGIAVGFITGRMLLKRTVNIFKPATFAGLAVVMVLVFGSMGLAKMDVMGLVHWVPAPEEVESVSVCYEYDDVAYVAREPDEIREMLEIHREIIAERETLLYNSWGETIVLTYTMKNGAVVNRYYQVEYISSPFVKLMPKFSQPEYLLQTDDMAALLEDVVYIDVYVYLDEGGITVGETGIGLVGEDARGFMEAIIADCKAGRWNPSWNYHSTVAGDRHLGSVTIQTAHSADRYLELWSSATETIAYLKEEGLYPVTD